MKPRVKKYANGGLVRPDLHQRIVTGVVDAVSPSYDPNAKPAPKPTPSMLPTETGLARKAAVHLATRKSKVDKAIRDSGG